MSSPHPATASAPSLDGRRFVLQSSTNSRVDPDAPSVFDYHEQDGIVWGDYRGDTVTFGRFVARRVGDVIDVAFVHRLVSTGEVVSGDSTSSIEVGDDGLRLVERFRIDGVDHESVCVELT